MKLLPNHPALKDGRTIHQKKVFNPLTSKSGILKPVGNNSKLGKGLSVVMKGKWRGMPMFSLTLEERKTCPRTCHHYDTCYGNNVLFAHRFEHGKNLEIKLSQEIEQLSRLYPHGFVVRLHVLGDFYSVKYVQLWLDFLAKYPNLHVFGYTARFQGAIAKKLAEVREKFSERFWVRTSRNPHSEIDGLYAVRENFEGDSITCPEQTGKTSSCLTCGLCWSVIKNVKFLTH